MISTTEIYSVLLLEFPYFKKINEEKRELLCKRTQHFIDGTDFIPRKGMVITNRMQILIAACSQQLTLAFPRHYDYAYFEKIIVYPEKYFSTYTEKYHTGEMNTAGIVVFSWEDFYKGISIDNDTYNVGVHEFAHALEFTDIANQDIDEVFSACLDKFTALASHYLQHQPDKPLFRTYATTNLSEFFAVATEYYFEAPKEFAEREPELYDILNKAYRQNTVSTSFKSVAKRNFKINAISKRYLSSDISFKHSNVTFYLIIGVVAVILAYNVSLTWSFGLLIVVFCLDVLSAPLKTFSLYDSYVTIHQEQKWTKRLMHYFFPDKNKVDPIIDYSDVLYVNAVHVRDEEGSGEYYLYTLHYLQQDTLMKITCMTTNMDYEQIFRFLYLEKKVGTRLDGKYKKYKNAGA